jgi:hypothetical protein
MFVFWKRNDILAQDIGLLPSLITIQGQVIQMDHPVLISAALYTRKRLSLREYLIDLAKQGSDKAGQAYELLFNPSIASINLLRDILASQRNILPLATPVGLQILDQSINREVSKDGNVHS